MEGLAFGLIEWIITGAVGGFCGLVITGMVYLKNRIEDSRGEAESRNEEVRKSMHELEKKLIAEYASKADLKEVVRESLAPLKEAMAELKGDLKATIAAIDGYKRWGPPE